MSRLPSVTGKQLIGALRRLGFCEVRIRGSHHYLRHADGRVTVVPAHAGEAIGPGLPSRIPREAEISKEDLGANL
jgi:predicted RNA binding protein YcfA (HicA-like mRNA interferase family)